jgi:FtsP/CotA-like multicopper oxidase with cupredoxin domain
MILKVSRRSFLVGSASVAAALAVHNARSQPATQTGPDGFRVLRATTAPSGTGAWNYNGVVPGPLLRARQGEEVRIRLNSELPEATAIHWHGVRIPSAMGGLQTLTQPLLGRTASTEYRFTAAHAGTYCYHAPYTMPGQIGRGLCGVFIVDEKVPVPVDQDLVIVIGDTPAAAQTIATRSNERLRFRLVNVSAARHLSLRFDRHAVRVMAIDGQPAEPFLAHESHLSLGPGNRMDVFVDATLEPGGSASIFLDDKGAEKEIARLVYESEKRRAALLPAAPSLPANPLPARIDMRNALRVEAPLHETEKKTWAAATPSPEQLGPPLFSVKRDRAVVLTLPNQGDDAHAVHLHGHHARLLDNLDDGWKPFWLDTILAGPRRTTRIAFVADNPGRWLLHAQALGREAGRMAWFEVT